MGLLDDAIREHLELKRRAGADPGEIARLEQEALGPARREPAAPEHGHEEPGAEWHAHEGAQDYDDEPLYEDVHAPEPAHHEPEPAYHEPEPAHHDPEPAHDQPTQQFSLRDLEDGHEAPAPGPATEEHPAPEDHHPALDEPPAPPSHPHEPEIVPADEEPGEDDVLEETPEFLQETPEHDRLWFEQKPPRDFDF